MKPVVHSLFFIFIFLSICKPSFAQKRSSYNAVVDLMVLDLMMEMAEHKSYVDDFSEAVKEYNHSLRKFNSIINEINKSTSGIDSDRKLFDDAKELAVDLKFYAEQILKFHEHAYYDWDRSYENKKKMRESSYRVADWNQTISSINSEYDRRVKYEKDLKVKQTRLAQLKKLREIESELYDELNDKIEQFNAKAQDTGISLDDYRVVLKLREEILEVETKIGQSNISEHNKNRIEEIKLIIQEREEQLANEKEFEDHFGERIVIANINKLNGPATQALLDDI